MNAGIARTSTVFRETNTSLACKMELVDAVMITMLKIMKIKTFFQVNGHRQ